jgi:hypothetical protein
VSSHKHQPQPGYLPPCPPPSGSNKPRGRLSGKPVSELLTVEAGKYFDVPQGVLPEATKQYYEDSLLKVRRPAVNSWSSFMSPAMMGLAINADFHLHSRSRLH